MPAKETAQAHCCRITVGLRTWNDIAAPMNNLLGAVAAVQLQNVALVSEGQIRATTATGRNRKVGFAVIKADVRGSPTHRIDEPTCRPAN